MSITIKSQNNDSIKNEREEDDGGDGGEDNGD